MTSQEQVERLRNSLARDIDRLYSGANREIQRKIRPYLDKIILKDEEATQKERIAHAEKDGNLDEVVSIAVAITVLTNQRAINRINRRLDDVYDIGTNAVAENVLKKTGIDISRKSPDIKNLLTRYTKRAYARNTDKLHISAELDKRIRDDLAAGKGLRPIAKSIRTEFGKSRNSSMMTVTTESTRIHARARLDTLNEGKRRGMVFEKIWRHSPHVKAPRDWHMDMDGERQPLDKPFSNGLMSPGDPSGPAYENINCHCWLDEELISW